MQTNRHRLITFFARQKTLLLAAITVAAITGGPTVHAQVGIGTISPSTGAALDVTSTGNNKGFLPPRVALTARNSSAPIGTFVSGMIVYNTATGGAAPNRVSPGLYYCNGTAWVRLIVSKGDQTVDVSGLSANLTPPSTFSGATFSPNTPANADKIYVNTADGSTWTYNGTNYDSFVDDPSTPFYLAPNTNDAATNKTSSIYRSGNIGIGTNTPHAPLQFSSVSANRKIVLNEVANDNNQFYGLGTGNNELRYNVSNPGSHVFYSGTSSAATELARITSTGRLGLGASTPSNRLEVNGALAIGASYVNGTTALVNGAIIQGNVGIGTNIANAPLQFASTLANRKIVLWENANNDNQYYGLGINPNVMRYQVATTASSHVFYAGVNPSDSVELMRITGTGDVGINNMNPSVKLDIVENDAPTSSADNSLSISATNTNRVAAIRMFSSNGNATLFGQNGGSQDGGLLPNAAYWGAPGGGHDYQIITSGLANSNLVPTAALTIKNNTNYVGFGTSTPHAPIQIDNSFGKKIVMYETAINNSDFYGFALDDPFTLRYQVGNPFASHVFYAANGLGGNIKLASITNAGHIIPPTNNTGSIGNGTFAWSQMWSFNYVNLSDRNLKTNIRDINYGLKDIMKLHAVTYNWKTDPDNNQTVGLIAQEVEKIIPEVVAVPKKEGDHYGIAYNELVPVLIKGIQEQQAQIADLKTELSDKDQRIATLEAKEAAYAQLASQVKEMRQMLGLKKKTYNASVAKK